MLQTATEDLLCFCFVVAVVFVSLQKGEQSLGSQALSRAISVDEQKTFGVVSSCSNEAVGSDDFRAHFFRFPLHSSRFGDGHIVHGTAPSAPT